MQFIAKQPHYEYLRKKWIGRQKSASEKFLSTHSESLRKITAGGLGGLMLLNTPAVANVLPLDHQIVSSGGINKAEDKSVLLAGALKEEIPQEVRKLSSEEEGKIGEILSERTGFKVSAELDGVRLNRSYGMIGGEQHLYRYPGDTVNKHAKNTQDWAMYGGAGIAPGLGAWGYFSPSEAAFSPKDEERERYYLAVPTFLAPGFAENVGKYRDFFKFRKMLVVNPKTGQAVVAVVGDAGPAEWTGKHLGGSPEVMHYLGLAGGPRKGAVLYYFLDDPKDEVSLGPVKLKESFVAEKSKKKEDKLVRRV